MGALSFLGISNNWIGDLVWLSGWKDNCGDDGWELDTRYQHTDGTKQGNEPDKRPEGDVAIANTIRDMRALTSLHMSANGLKGAEAGKALGDAIAANTVLKELDISGGQCTSEQCDVEFVQTFSVGLRANEAISSVNVRFNDIGTEQAQALANILKEHATLKSLCGNKGNETELDMSGEPGKRLGAEGAIILAPEIADNGAISSLNLSQNALTSGKYNRISLLSGTKSDPVKHPYNYETDMSGLIALADAIKDMGALTTLMFGDKKVVTMTTEMTEANFSGKLESHEAQIVAAFLPKCT
jgi:hypothetical protein